jgi:PEGA domain
MYKKIAALLFIALLFTGCSLGKSKAGIIVKSNPAGNVFINDKEVGVSPYQDENMAPGSYTVRIKSESGEWTSNKIRILENTIYNINRELAVNSSEQAGENVSIEKGKGITVVTLPSQVEVSLDGQKQGNTPYLIPSASEGEHEILLTKEGYVSRKIKIRARDDYKIVIEAQLKKEGTATTQPSPTAAPSSTASASPSAKATATAKASASVTPKASASATPKASVAASTAPGANTVTILDTPTGWLRVRDKAGIEGKEIAKVNTNESFPYEEQLDSGWTLIVMADGTKGYVASRYVKVNK